MYGDDTILYCNINQNIGEELINAELMKLWEWLGANKLSLNIAKIKYMVFHTSKSNVIYPNLKVNNNNIERVTEFNVLGVILHSHMTWNKHINHISMKIARSIGIVYRLRNVYPVFFVKPVLPTATERYEIRNPSFHALAIKHKFTECSLQYCLIN